MPHLILVIAPAVARIRIVRELLDSLKKEGYDLDRRLAEARWEDLFEEAMTPGLFAAKRVFLVEDGSRLGPLAERYEASLEGKGAEVVFMALYEKDPKKDLGNGVYGRAQVVRHEPAPTWPQKRRGWLLSLAREQKISLTPEAAALMVEWIDDEEELRSELAKLGSAAGKGKVDEKLVRDLSVDEGSKAILNLLDGIAQGNVAKVLKAFGHLRESGELIVALSAVEKRVRAGYYCSVLGPGSVKALKLTEFQGKAASDLARRFSSQSLSCWLVELIRLSWSERTGDGEGWNGLERTVLGALASRNR